MNVVLFCYDFSYSHTFQKFITQSQRKKKFKIVVKLQANASIYKQPYYTDHEKNILKITGCDIQLERIFISVMPLSNLFKIHASKHCVQGQIDDDHISKS